MEALRSRDVLWTYEDAETSVEEQDDGGIAYGPAGAHGHGAFQRGWEERMGWEEEKRVWLRA